MKQERIYTDSSVMGGYFDKEFAEDSKRFFDAVKAGYIKLLLSEVVVREILKAPAHVQDLPSSIPASNIEQVPITNEVLALRDAY